MVRLSAELSNKIAKNCLDCFNNLPKTGKPVDKEWTVLSCVVQYDSESDNIQVVSLGTGSKCIGATKMCPSGSVLNDSHAEVFARRGFLLYLYDNIEKTIARKPSIFIRANEKFKLQENIQFIFYSTQLPCGDASIMPKVDDDEHFGDVLHLNKRQAIEDICEIKSKVIKSDSDIHRTGAKCLPNSEQDPKEVGPNYHLLGRVRTKPGRGDRTLSVSCSDKMARWVHLGIQGSLLSMFIDTPIYIKHFIFGAGVPYSEESLNRALLKRDQVAPFRTQVHPEFHQSLVTFPYLKNEDNVRSAPASIVWIKANKPILEVAVQGKKLGVTKKKANLLSCSLCISKFKLYERFQNVLHNQDDLKNNLFGETLIENIPYSEMKRKSKMYVEKWSEVREKFFKIWTVKPDIWNFCVNVT